MKPVYQSRIGERGRCFPACLASILEVPEASVPDFDRPVGTDYWKNVASFLAKHGLKYTRVPLDTPPVGWGTIEGISPRGGNHACVSFNGKLVHDPHKPDGTGNGLVEPKYYGLLTPLRKKAEDALQPIPALGIYPLAAEPVRDAAPLSGKRLNAAAEKLHEKHDDIDDTLERQEWMRQGGPAIAAYNATHRGVVDLVKEAAALLGRSRIDDDAAYWQAKLDKAKQALAKSEEHARKREYGLALSYQEGAFTLAHSVIDKMRRSGPPGKARDDLKLIPNSKDGSQTLTYPKQVRTYHTWATKKGPTK